MNNTALRAELLSAGGTYSATTGAEAMKHQGSKMFRKQRGRRSNY